MRPPKPAAIQGGNTGFQQAIQIRKLGRRGEVGKQKQKTTRKALNAFGNPLKRTCLFGNSWERANKIRLLSTA